MKILGLLMMCFLLTSLYTQAQERTFTKDEVLAMTETELQELSLEDLMRAVDVIGVSSPDELFAMIMNKSISSASKNEESSFTTPLSSTMITKEELLQWGCNSIEEALRLIPGVFVSTKTNGNYDVQLRGLNNIAEGQRLLYTENHATKLLLDGRDITDYISGTMFMDFLPIGIEDIKSIEVVRGATSALYGQNALNGVINIITEKPGDNLEYMTSGFIQTSFDFGTTIANVATRLKLNNHVNVGASIALESRNRTTTDLYIPNKERYYYSEDFDNHNHMGHSLSQITEFKGGWIDYDKVGKLRTLSDDGITYVPVLYTNVNIDELIPDPLMAKKQKAVNGYVNLHFDKIVIDVTGGYNKTEVNTSTLDESVFTLGGRRNQGGYINVNGNLNDFNWVVNFDKHSNDYCVGTPGYQVDVTRFGGLVDYSFYLLNNDLLIRPIVEFTGYITHDKKTTYTKDINGDSYIYSSFFGKEHVDTYTTAPSLMMTYKINDWKFMGAARLDMTTNPKRNNMNYLASISKDINNKHFLRVEYGRATQSAVLTNTDVNYVIDRHDIGAPQYIFLKGSTHDLNYIDNFEFGYRVRPTSSLLIDLEAFYSISQDYGSLKTNNSYLTTTGEKLVGWLTTAFDNYMSDGEQGVEYFIKNNWNDYYTTNSVIQYENIPFNVYQKGISMNIDYIVNKHLILKANLNCQQTKIDNHYSYNQKDNIRTQLKQCINNDVKDEYGINSSVAGATIDILKGAYTYMLVDQQMNNSATTNTSRIEEYFMMCVNVPTNMYDKCVHIDKNEILKLRDAFIYQKEYVTPDGEVIPHNEMLSIYYGIMYGIDNIGSEGFKLGSNKGKKYELSDNYKHKATPSFYGSIGFIYKPVGIINCSALMSFMSKREYNTSYGYASIPSLFNLNIKLGWTPNKNVEFFLQGHNILKNNQEFVYGDEVKTQFTTGLTCKF